MDKGEVKTREKHVMEEEKILFVEAQLRLQEEQKALEEKI